MKDVYPHVLVQLLAVALGWMEPEGNFKYNISPRLESILVAVILNDFSGKNFVLKNAFYIKNLIIYTYVFK
jgi:hypothetical protein